MKKTVLFTLLLLPMLSFAQNSLRVPTPTVIEDDENVGALDSTSTNKSNDKVYTFVNVMPEPSVDVNQFVNRHLRYPLAARENNIQGRVVVRFIIDENGNVTEPKVTQSVGGGCDEEALRVISKMPPWKPGRSEGKPVKVYYTMPISFRLYGK